MLSFLRKIRKNALLDNKIAGYLFYAIGEIALIVIGILIAMQINNWNENKKSQDQLNNIYGYILLDLEADTTEVGAILRNYEQRTPVFRRVLADSATVEDYKTNPFYRALVSTYLPFAIDQKGYNLLKNYNNSVVGERDTLVTEIGQFYTSFIDFFEKFGLRIQDDVIENIQDWKNNQDWFSEVYSGQLSEGYLDYVLNDKDYKNKVVFHRAMVYNNMVPILEAYKRNAEEIMESIKNRTTDEK